MSRVLSVALSLVLFAVACGDDGQGAPATSTTTSTTAGTSTTTTSTTTTSTTTTQPESIVVQVFFLDEEAFNIGRLPYVRPVDRTVDPDTPEAAALDALFEGPTGEEQSGGLRFVASEATGIAEFSILERTARVRLAGGCSSGGSTFTVANEIVPTLLQFTSIDAVKIYDTEGETGSPDTPGDSIPFCLEP
jgi:hypothetical protein